MVKKIARSVTKASELPVRRVLPQRGLLSNPQLGLEALCLGVSCIGMDDYAKKARRFSVASSWVQSPALLNKLQARQWVVKPFPGYIFSVKEISSFNVAEQAELLNKIYGAEAKYQGVFVPTFEELRSLSFRPVEDGVDAASALLSAKIQAANGKTGFLALSVKGNSYRPKDVLVWDAAQQNWLSWNQSKAAVLRKEHEALRMKFKDENAYWAWQLENQGIIVRPDSYNEPTSIRVSVDGVNWQQLELNSPTAEELWDAWSQNMYISYDRHAHTARFAVDKDAPLFSSPEVALLWKDATNIGVRMTESSKGEPVLSLDDMMCPNLYSYGADGQLNTVPGVELKVNEFLWKDPIRFMEDLQKIALEELKAHPSAKLIFLGRKSLFRRV